MEEEKDTKKLSKKALDDLIDKRTKENLPKLLDALRDQDKEVRTREKTAEKLANTGIVADMNYIGGGYNLVKTIQGSVIDLTRKGNPWVRLSPEMENFCKAFTEYIRAQKSGRASCRERV